MMNIVARFRVSNVYSESTYLWPHSLIDLSHI